MLAPPAPSPRSNSAYWACQLGGWYGIAAFQIIALFVVLGTTLPPMADEEAKAALVLLKTLLADNFWLLARDLLALHTVALLLSHLLHGYIKQRRWADAAFAGKVWRVLLAGLLCSAPLGFVQQFTTVGALAQFNSGIPLLTQLQHAMQWAPFFWFWLLVYFVILNQRRLRVAEHRQSELARALQAAELRGLKAQLNPHFLFNSLNSVRALIADDPSRAQSAVTQLARTLRYTLASGQDELVTLEQELEIVNDYLGLESLRLGARLRIERDISPEALRVRIPVMLMQTIVENAIKHGVAELPDGGVLQISAQVRNGSLLLEIANPRPAALAPNPHSGIGLRNATERLRLLFGAHASLDLDLSDPELALARIRLPA